MTDNTSGNQGSSPSGQQNLPQYGENLPQYGEKSDAPYGQQAQSPYGQQGAAPYGQQAQSPYGQQGGNDYPGQQGYQGQVAENPGRTLGIVGFILAILIAPVGLIISIVAFVKSRKAKMGNGLALAGIIIGVLFTIIGSLILFGLIAFFADVARELGEACEGMPSGTPVTIQGQPSQCP